jgi:hypothetical protein
MGKSWATTSVMTVVDAEGTSPTSAGPTNGIGLAGIGSEVYKKVHRTFQVDQHR